MVMTKFAGREFLILKTVNRTRRWERKEDLLTLLVWKHPDAPYGCALVWDKETLIRSKYDEDPEKLVREAMGFIEELRQSLSGLFYREGLA
jgi:hypothetical protein